MIDKSKVKNMFVRYREAASQDACALTSARARRRSPRQRADSERGAALVEFALIVPIFFVLVFGMCSFGFMLAHYLELTEAVNIGGEQLAIARGNTLDPCALAFTAVTNVSPYLNSSTMTFTLTLNGTAYGPYTGGSSKVTCSSTSTSTGAPANLIQGDPIVLFVSYPCSVFSFKNGLVNFNPVPVCNLPAQITEISQ
jgi:Flp pilus assembly protein TadG